MSDNDDKYFDLFAKVFEFFNEDMTKTCTWWTTKNPHLGNRSPQELERRDTYVKLKDFIETQLDENKRIDDHE